jgi:predicted tellurium resistance membrane protein TerC
MLAWIADVDVWASLVRLTTKEIVLGIDNVVFISVLSRLERGAARASIRQWRSPRRSRC